MFGILANFMGGVSLRTLVWPLVIIGLSLLIGGFLIQTKRANIAEQKAFDLEVQIKNLKAGILLTEELRMANAAITRQRDDLLKELENAEGFDAPLPADIRRVLDRLRP